MPTLHQLDEPTVPVEGVYADGMIRLDTPLDLPAGTRVRVRVAAGVSVETQHVASVPDPGGVGAPTTAGWRGGLAGWQAGGLAGGRSTLRPYRWHEWTPAALFVIGLVTYLITRFWAIESFPIYFFSDEAAQTINATALLNNGMRDFQGTLLPPYFQNVDRWNLGLSVYIQLIGAALFGESVIVTRGVSAAVSVLAVVAVTIMLRRVLQVRAWWAGAFVLAALPVWLLHARTAFETVMMVAFYACFLCCYLLYRTVDPRYLLATLLFAGATFYSYANGQGVIGISLLLLLAADARYHLAQIRTRRRLVAAAALLLALLTLPYLRFRALHPAAVGEHLRLLDSYITQDLPLGEKVWLFFANYGWGLSPNYWFLPHDQDLIRHYMPGFGHLQLVFLPFALVGLWVCVRRWRTPASRVILIALLAAPCTAALVGIGPPRVLAIVIPAALLITIGIDAALTFAQRRIAFAPLAIGSAALLGALSLITLRSALVDGPTWSTNYSMGGLQYGAIPVFSAVVGDLDADPARTVMLSPTWANGTDQLAQFFLDDTQLARVSLASIDTYLVRRTEIPPQMLFVLPVYEFDRAAADPKLVLQPPLRIIPYPDGTPGFYFVQIAYAADADARFAEERIARARPVEDTIVLAGETVAARYSLLDMGELVNIFDGDPGSLLRGAEANPFVIELDFPSPRALREIALTVGSMDFGVEVVATTPDGTTQTRSEAYRNMPDDPQVIIALDGTPVQQLRIAITNLNISPGDITSIHVRELELR